MPDIADDGWLLSTDAAGEAASEHTFRPPDAPPPQPLLVIKATDRDGLDFVAEQFGPSAG